jgi:hypothetical protein
MNQMLDELMFYEWDMPMEIIVKCKELIDVERQQIEDAMKKAVHICMDNVAYDKTFEVCEADYGYIDKEIEEYFNEKYEQ